MTVVTGSRYLGRFIGNREAANTWLADKAQGWEESVKTLSGVVHNHPQSAYAGLKNSPQQEWEFVKQVTPDIGDTLGPVEQAQREAFITDLFHGLGERKLGRGFICLTLKQSGLDLPYPKNKAPENCKAYCVITGHLIAELRGQEEFSMADQSAYIQ